MECPKDHNALASLAIGSVCIDRCPSCGGTWYDFNELRVLKDKEARGDYCWIDFDLWKDIDKFRATSQEAYACPKDGTPMTTVHYGDSPILVDICSQCRGTWLENEGYEKIIAYLDKTVNTQSVRDYLSDIRQEFLEVFARPEGRLPEIQDFGKVLYLLQLRFVIQHPRLAIILGMRPPGS